MCDYSLHHVATRPAQIEDKLVTTKFKKSITRGFAAIGEPHVAVCLLPGTEIAFDENVECEPAFGVGILANKKIGQQLARFRQINMHNPVTHHDALEFPDGRSCCSRACTRASAPQCCSCPPPPAPKLRRRGRRRRFASLRFRPDGARASAHTRAHRRTSVRLRPRATGTAGGSFNSAFVGKPPCCYVPLLFSVRCLSLGRHRHRSQRAPNTASTRRVTRERCRFRKPYP
jgi:hypothetical protein